MASREESAPTPRPVSRQFSNIALLDEDAIRDARHLAIANPPYDYRHPLPEPLEPRLVRLRPDEVARDCVVPGLHVDEVHRRMTQVHFVHRPRDVENPVLVK